jgi:hypothetical protein
MSEGARLDPLRRANMGVLSHEQMLPSVEMNREKWKAVLKKMRKHLKDDKLGISKLVLIDDFVGSGTTFLRLEDDGWDGKLCKMLNSLPDQGKDWIIEDGATVHVHHYIGSESGQSNLNEKANDAKRLIKDKTGKDLSVEFTFGWRLPGDVVAEKTDPLLAPLVEKYYSTDIETDANTAGGGTDKDIRWGYKKCRLVLVLEHNTPNNSLPLIWGHTENDPKMRALFRRR